VAVDWSVGALLPDRPQEPEMLDGAARSALVTGSKHRIPKGSGPVVVAPRLEVAKRGSEAHRSMDASLPRPPPTLNQTLLDLQDFRSSTPRKRFAHADHA
jgi:hypothetical protein